MNDQKVLIGAISGVLAGVAIGMLVAPVSGSEARQKIADSAGDLKTKVKDLTKKASVKLDDLRSTFENEIEGLGDDVRQKILKLMDSGRTTANNIKEGASQVRDGANQMRDGANTAAGQ
jgi:X-X-X-Leu-X-X-Gly heptad repeat protein